MLIAQCPYSARLHQEMALAQPLPHPPNRKRPENMPMSDDQHIAICRPILMLANHRLMVFLPDLPDQPVHPLNNIARTFTPGSAIFPDIPRADALLSALFLDLCRRNAFVLAVVPLADVVGDGDFGVGAFRRGL